MDQVIKKDLKKGILYPYVTPSGEVRSDEVCLYQTLSGHKFPQHWYKYLQLKANKTSEEMLTEHLETEDSPLDKAESTEEFPEILEDVTDEMGDAKITVEMGNTTVKFTLKEVLEQEDVKLTETQNGFQLVVLGNRPIIKFHNGSEYREILTGVDEYESLRELVE